MRVVEVGLVQEGGSMNKSCVSWPGETIGLSSLTHSPGGEERVGG